MKITKSWKFSAAHRIATHPGICSSLHGHNWTVDVTLEGEFYGSMLLDFDEVKQAIIAALGGWDHAVLLKHDDPLYSLLARDKKQRLVLFADEPSTETVATTAFQYLGLALGEHKRLLKVVTVHETPNNLATCERK